MQGGKFPTTSEVTNYAGGSHYIIKNIIEELKYKSKNSSSDQRVFLVEKDAVEKAEVKVGKVSQSDETGEFIPFFTVKFMGFFVE